MIHHARLVSRHDALQEGDLNLSSSCAPVAAARVTALADRGRPMKRSNSALFDEEHEHLFK